MPPPVETTSRPWKLIRTQKSTHDGPLQHAYLKHNNSTTEGCYRDARIFSSLFLHCTTLTTIDLQHSLVYILWTTFLFGLSIIDHKIDPSYRRRVTFTYCRNNHYPSDIPQLCDYGLVFFPGVTNLAKRLHRRRACPTRRTRVFL